MSCILRTLQAQVLLSLFLFIHDLYNKARPLALPIALGATELFKNLIVGDTMAYNTTYRNPAIQYINPASTARIVNTPHDIYQQLANLEQRSRDLLSWYQWTDNKVTSFGHSFVQLDSLIHMLPYGECKDEATRTLRQEMHLSKQFAKLSANLSNELYKVSIDKANLIEMVTGEINRVCRCGL